MSKSVIIIPPRLAATRLPKKPLIKINNKSIIMHVYEKALKSNIGEVYVATCDKEIAIEVKKYGGKFIMTNTKHSTGTDRVYEASQKLKLDETDFIINLQGDEPMINPKDIKNLNKLSKDRNLEFSTLAYGINDEQNFNNEDIVKVITKNKLSSKFNEKALNFCRIVNSKNIKNVYHHLGVYLYKISALKRFVNFKNSYNEIREKLEQLRAIDNGMEIDVILANHFSSGIDTKKDLDEYIKLLNK